MSTIFHFILHQMIALKELWKLLFISSKSSFLSWDIQIFVFLSTSLFSLVIHCFRGWSRTNLKVYDVTNCLNKNLTLLVWFLEKEKKHDIETLYTDRVLNKEHFYGKNHSENMHQQVVIDPFLILVNKQKQQLHVRNFII